MASTRVVAIAFVVTAIRVGGGGGGTVWYSMRWWHKRILVVSRSVSTRCLFEEKEDEKEERGW